MKFDRNPSRLEHRLACVFDARRRSGRLARIPALIGAFVLSGAPLVRAGDWYVDVNAPNCASGTGGPSDPFCNIADALAVAFNGDTIHIAPGTYFENLKVNDDVTMVGTQGAATTIVDGGRNGNVIEVATFRSVVIDGLTVQNGLATYGAGIWVRSQTDLTLVRSVVKDNVLDPATLKPDKGGGIYVDHSKLTIDDCQILSNSAAERGGGVGGDAATIVVTNSLIRANEAGVSSDDWPRDDAFGGGIYNERGSLTIADSTIESNSIYDVYPAAGSAYGGGVCIVMGSVTLTNSTFDGNVVGFDSYYAPFAPGGSVWAEEGTVKIEGCGFANSFASYYGGAVGVEDCATVSVIDSKFRANLAYMGGGLYIGPGCNATIERSNFIDNEAGEVNWLEHGTGGGVALRSVATMVDCRIADNRAFTGGGLATDDRYEPVLLSMTRCQVTGNIANYPYYDGIGGGMYFEGTLLATDCDFTDNEVIGEEDDPSYIRPAGGGIYLAGAMTLVNCTVAGNRVHHPNGSINGLGGGIYVDSTPGSIDHVVIAGNEAATGTDIDGDVNSLGYNCIGDTGDANILGDPTGNLLDVDPLFADPANGNYSLSAASPCIDAGDPSLALSGMDGGTNPRLLDGNLDRSLVVDMGAREFSNVRLVVTGTPTPGSTLTFKTTGAPGLPVFLFLGLGQSELFFNRYGALFVDLAQTWLLVSWGTIPSTVDIDIDPTFPAPITVYAQELALGAAHTGNFGNLVPIDVE